MAVEHKHEEFLEYYHIWDKCEDCAEGQDEIHKEGVEYLPRLSGQSDSEYKAYKERALFYNASSRTIQGLLGMLFLKPPVVEYPMAIQNIIDDVDMAGTSFSEFAQEVAQQVITVGRCGVLVDYPPVESVELTIAQAQQIGLRAYATIYEADDVINWKTQRIANQQKLSLVVLEESREVAKNEFESESVKQWRVLELIDGIYRQRLFEKDDKGNDIVVAEYYPTINGRVLDFIPFQFFGSESNSECVSKPPLLDLVNVNLSHYRTTADYENGAHFTGLPMPIITGLTDTPKINIGSSTALVLPDPQSKAFYLEFTGQGLDTLEKLLRAKESMMATLGARMLAPEAKGIESAQTASIHRAGENSVLSKMSQLLSQGLTNVVSWLRDWSNVTGDVVIELNRDFVPNSMTAQELQALVQAWQSGALSYQSLFENLKAGDIIAPDRNVLDEQELIAMNPVGGALL